MDYDKNYIEVAYNPKELNEIFIKEFISFRKALIDIGYLTMGTLKGAIFGSVAGAGVAGGVALRNIIEKAPKTLQKMQFVVEICNVTEFR